MWPGKPVVGWRVIALNFFCCLGLIAVAVTNWLPRGWAGTTLNLWVIAFCCKAIATGRLVGGNVPPNYLSQTQTDCSQSQTDWQRRANNCSLIYKRRQIANRLQSVGVSLCRWAARLCYHIYFKLGCNAMNHTSVSYKGLWRAIYCKLC